MEVLNDPPIAVRYFVRWLRALLHGLSWCFAQFRLSGTCQPWLLCGSRRVLPHRTGLFAKLRDPLRCAGTRRSGLCWLRKPSGTDGCSCLCQLRKPHSHRTLSITNGGTKPCCQIIAIGRDVPDPGISESGKSHQRVTSLRVENSVEWHFIELRFSVSTRFVSMMG